jgi:hypothetical protein
MVEGSKIISDGGINADHYGRKGQRKSRTAENGNCASFRMLDQRQAKSERDISNPWYGGILLRREDKKILIRQECVLFRKPEAVTFHLSN